MITIWEYRRKTKRTRASEKIRVQEFKELEEEKNRLMERVERQVLLTKQLKEIIEEYAKQVGCALPRDPQGAGEDV